MNEVKSLVCHSTGYLLNSTGRASLSEHIAEHGQAAEAGGDGPGEDER